MFKVTCSLKQQKKLEKSTRFNTIQDGAGRDFFEVAHRWGRRGKKAPLPKIWLTYPAMMKLGTVIPCLKNIQRIYTPSEFYWYQH